VTSNPPKLREILNDLSRFNLDGRRLVRHPVARRDPAWVQRLGG
jgi:hypothetical protein